MSTPYSPYDPGQQQGGVPGAHPQPGAYPPPGGYGYTPYPPQQGDYAPTAPRSYLQGGPAGFGDAVKLAFRNIFTYQGRASRSAYWWFVLFSVLVFIAAAILAAVLKAFGQAIDVIAYIGLFLTSLSLTIRRLHDTDRSGVWYLIGFVPFIGGIVLLVFTLLEGTRGPNRFG